ncbi:MAG: glycosyltransferase family 2 protein [Candidatus Bathyarchaeia archaeon]
MKLKAPKLVSVIIPVINEEKGLQRVLNEIPKKELEEIGYKCEIIVVDGGSTDRSRDIAIKNGTKVVVEPRKGYGRAYKTGFLHASGDIIVTLDGDYSYPACLIPKLVRILDEMKLDFISTNRMKNFEHGSFSILHIIGNKLLTLLTKLLFKINIDDSQSGMWVFRKHMLDKIYLLADDMAFSEEIKIFAFRLFKAMEVPIPYRRRMGKPKLNTLLDGIRNLLHLFSLRVRLSKLMLVGLLIYTSAINQENNAYTITLVFAGKSSKFRGS